MVGGRWSVVGGLGTAGKRALHVMPTGTNLGVVTRSRADTTCTTAVGVVTRSRADTTCTTDVVGRWFADRWTCVYDTRTGNCVMLQTSCPGGCNEWPGERHAIFWLARRTRVCVDVVGVGGIGAGNHRAPTTRLAAQSGQTGMAQGRNGFGTSVDAYVRS